MKGFREYLLLTLVAGAAVAGYILWRVGAGDVFRLLQAGRGEYLFLYLIISILIAAFLTIKWAVVLHAQDDHVPFHRLFAYRLVGYSVNYLTPTMHVGSEPIRAFLLKGEGVTTERAFSNVIIDKSVELMTNVSFFFIGALLLLNSVDVEGYMKLTVLIVSLVLMLGMGLFIGGVLGKQSMFVAIFRTLRLHKIKKLQHIEENLAKIERDVEDFYRRKPYHFLSLIGIMVVLWILMYFEYRSVLLFLGHEANILQIFLILTGVGLAYSIPVPAAIGTLELGQLSAAKVLDLGSVTGVTLAFIIRSRDLIWAILGIIFIFGFKFDFKGLAERSHEIKEQFEKGDLPIRQGHHGNQ